MISTGTVADDLFFSQKITIKKKYSNRELKLHQYFYHITNIYPENIIQLKKFIFFFVNNENYFKAIIFLNYIRKQLWKKVLIIRAEDTLIKLLFGLFPDPYIHDIKVEMNIYSGKKIVNVCFLSFEERGIAIGRSGDYIKAVNEIFEKYIIFENSGIPIKIKCELINL